MTAKDRMARAEDYVFGLMNEQERERAERDMEVDHEFRDCVMVLAERLRMLHRAKGAAPMSDADWSQITQHIALMPQMSGQDAAARLATMGMAQRDPTAKGILGVKRPGAHQFAGWRGTVVSMALIAAMVIGWYAGKTTAPAPTPVVVALLDDLEGAPAVMVEAYSNDSLRILPLVAVDVPDGRVLQLWTWRGDMAVPLAAFHSATEMMVQGPEIAAPEPGQAYAITLENAPGSATGRPGNDVLFSGEAIAPPR